MHQSPNNAKRRQIWLMFLAVLVLFAILLDVLLVIWPDKIPLDEEPQRITLLKFWICEISPEIRYLLIVMVMGADG